MLIFQLVVCLLFCLDRPIDLGGPLGSPQREVPLLGHSMVLPGEAEGRLHVGVPWFSHPARINGGPHLGNVLFDQVTSRRPDGVPSVPTHLLGFLSALISHLH